MPIIPDKYKKAVKSEKSGNIILPAGRMMYASLFTATRPSKTETDEKKFQYAVTILLPKDTDLAALEKEIEGIFHENVPEAKRATTKWANPIKKTADEGTLAAYAEDYPTCLRMNSKRYQRDGKERQRPDVVTASGQAVPEADEPAEVYNGRWTRVSVNPFWYSTEKNGISLGLQNVQLLWNDDPLAGGKAKATSDFDPVDEADLADEAFA